MRRRNRIERGKVEVKEEIYRRTLHTTRQCEDTAGGITPLVREQIRRILLLRPSAQPIHCFSVQQARAECAHAAERVRLAEAASPVRVHRRVGVADLAGAMVRGPDVGSLEGVRVVGVCAVDTEFRVGCHGGGGEGGGVAVAVAIDIATAIAVAV